MSEIPGTGQRLLTDGRTGANLGNPTDKYSYDAWGGLIWHERLTGSIDQPYQYVGKLGYYTHYQDPDFKLQQLGVRFYDSEIGRFRKKDTIRSDKEASYIYAANRPSVLSDPQGLWPTFVIGSKCTDACRTNYLNQRAIPYANTHIYDVHTQWTAAGIDTCNAVIRIDYCLEGLGGNMFTNRWCGNWNGGHSISVSFDWRCPAPECTMLHEAIHVCTGASQHGGWPAINIPGCGNISGQHTSGGTPW